MAERLNDQSNLNFAHTQAVRLAGEKATPGSPQFDYLYWVVMGTYGFKPYRTGGYSCSGW